ncbi:MAG: hypothetical protein A2782_04475 [Candidatus Blackburnbacteria bacterium RIFCSPHIGHO2_01_FULL_43_15b]|uniref:Uncharacterized protein n=1 Tax=Candidatus Blackburnbacteria bacterium RIFCSPHIGHO2_01_FULL_43_15b TaxID=1797513 RepID=A0A1G1V3I2_9BACT|nr:MAG: hypothetical protein A2782_04475 [Candidatus Blackburnbacteria bacterium RIFCSPHIGHO2_01_FULL_43_15b]
MNKNINAKTVILIVSTIVLALVAVGTAFWLYQLQSQPVAPNVPESKPKATAPSQANCTGGINFTLAAANNTDSPTTPTPTRAVGGVASPTPSLTPTVAPTAALTSSPVPTSAQGGSGSSGGTTSQAKATPAPGTALPDVGISWPVLTAVSAGALVLFIGILLAL